MTTFDERLKAELAKFKHDMEFEFRVRMRRDKLFALQVAKELGLAEAEALAYAKAVVLADFAQVGDDPVINKVVEDLQARGATVDPVGLQRDLDKLKMEAQQQVMQE